MPFSLVYHTKVGEEDLSRIPINVQQRIARAIEARIAIAPAKYGSPLTGTLKGYWKLRVGDYRVIYKVVRSEVRILGIIHRKNVYKNVVMRIG